VGYNVDFYRLSVSLESPVRLIAITGPPAAGKSTLSRKLEPRLGPGSQTFRLDDYINKPIPTGFPTTWSERRPLYLGRIGERIADWLRDGRVAVFEGVLVGSNEVPLLSNAARLSDAKQVFVIVIERSLAECWERWSRKPGALETEGAIRTIDAFQRGFYDPYYPKGVVPDLVLEGREVDTDIGVERVLRRLATRS
jgi:adenylylsulfate kinase-like enzyme